MAFSITFSSNPLCGTFSKRLSSSRSSRSSFVVASSSSSSSRRSDQANHDHHRLVDENMIVLRKRIHEMKMVERNYEPPSHWMDWEKKYYTSYDTLICQVMGFLQSQMMNTRPSLALGIVILVLFSVPTSSAMLFFHFFGSG